MPIMPHDVAPEMPEPNVLTPAVALRALRDKWANAKAAERANAQSYIRGLCEALGVPEPLPAGTGYEFELPIKLITRDGTEASGFVDCHKRDCFILEAKDVEGGASDVAMRRAYGQARQYAANDPSGFPPPYLLVLDIAKTLIVYHRWGGTYQGFAAGYRIDLPTLDQRPGDIELLRDIWTAPNKRDPRVHAQVVTRDIAEKLAKLAAALEKRGFESERVARFLMRVVFSCFAEDVDLLPRDAFRQTVQNAGVHGDPVKFQRALEGLWKAMDEGGMFGFESILEFNGHFFKDAEVLPLQKQDIALLLEAARADWKDVEPSIFGTLLTRALNPVERHRLGAEYTPRDFIERLVRPTVEEPVRERWTAVQAEVLQLRDSGRDKDRTTAEQRLRDFLGWLQGLRVLDPACGSGNFLYVTMHMLKDIEYEVVRELEALTGHTELRMQEIGPGNFYGIEVKPWAREIAELTLWIGFHQYWKRHHAVQPPEPVLCDTGTLELRDAVLAWDSVRHVPERDRPDPTPRRIHNVTGELVPDPEAVIPYPEYEGARAVEWPEADFIVGNPPYIGNKRMRDVLGDGYVEALRAAWPGVPDSVDFVMYWWVKAAERVAAGRCIRAGLITTNSITQPFHQPLIASARDAGAHVIWAAPDHPWVDEVDAAAVRVAMTVLAQPTGIAQRVDVGADASVVRITRVPALNTDLSVGADVAAASSVPLRANSRLSSRGFTLVGRGFVLDASEAARLRAIGPEIAACVRPYRNGQDIAQRARGAFVIDLGLRSDDEARLLPVLYDILRARVYDERQANSRRSYREQWWRFGEPRKEWRDSSASLQTFLATPYVAKHRYFVRLFADVAPDEKLVAIASSESWVLGVLSSTIHAAWAAAAGTRLGVGNDLTYNNSRCFDAFPFPNATLSQRNAIGDLAERIDAHRMRALRDERVTMTTLYNVIAKLRAGEHLTAKERTVHEVAACGVLADLHDALDRAVAEAYGWSWPEPTALILERLVALHDRRGEEEAAGTVRWLRPEYQAKVYDAGVDAAAPTLELPEVPNASRDAVETLAWPGDAVGQITVLRSMAALTPLSIEDAVRRLTGAKKEIVYRHLETLSMLGELRDLGGGRYAVAASVV